MDRTTVSTGPAAGSRRSAPPVYAVSDAEIWIRAMVADGFAFRLVASGDPRNPGDYNIFKRGRRDDVSDQSADLIAAIAVRHCEAAA